MNNKEIIVKVHNSIYHQIKEESFATPVQVLMELHILSKEDYERWRNGKIDYLERICKINLSKLNFILHEIQSYGKQHGLKESVTFYKQWGRKGKAVKI